MNSAQRILITTVSILSSAVQAVAQDEADVIQAPPAPLQMKSFEPMLGVWKGEGRMTMGMEGEGSPWSATLHAQRILDGHFVQVDEHYETAMGPLAFRTLYGWDAERERLVCAWVSNMGPGRAETRWVDESTLVGIMASEDDGMPAAYRFSYEFEEGAFSTRTEGVSGTGDFAVVSRGRYERSDVPLAVPGWKNAPSDTMKPLAPIVGSYSLTGKVAMPTMEFDIAALEDNQWMFGGAVVASHIRGQPEGYEAHGYFSWDPVHERYTHLYVSSMGEIGSDDAYLIDGKLVIVSSRARMGQPGAGRSVIEFEDGAVARSWSHRISGSGEPTKTFEASYKRAGSEE
jgi:hypothetical protein